MNRKKVKEGIKAGELATGLLLHGNEQNGKSEFFVIVSVAEESVALLKVFPPEAMNAELNKKCFAIQHVAVVRPDEGFSALPLYADVSRLIIRKSEILLSPQFTLRVSGKIDAGDLIKLQEAVVASNTVSRSLKIIYFSN